MTGRFHLAWCPRGSKHINVLTACVYSHGLAECQLCPAPTSSLSPIVRKFWKLLVCVCVCVCVRARAHARVLNRVWCIRNPILHPQISIIVPSPVSSRKLLECQNLSALASFLIQGFIYLTPVWFFFFFFPAFLAHSQLFPFIYHLLSKWNFLLFFKTHPKWSWSSCLCSCPPPLHGGLFSLFSFCPTPIHLLSPTQMVPPPWKSPNIALFRNDLSFLWHPKTLSFKAFVWHLY